MVRCKAAEILRNEAYLRYAAMTKDEGNAADDRFSATCQSIIVVSCTPSGEGRDEGYRATNTL